MSVSSKLSKREQNRLQNEELILEVLTIRSILFKTGFDETATNEMRFVAMLNALPNPPVTITGAPISYMGYRQMMSRIPKERLQYLYDKLTSEPYAVLLE